MQLATHNSQVATRSRDGGILIGGALIVLALGLAYANSFSNPLIFDDLESVRNNPTIRRLWDMGTVLLPPGRGAAVQNRPVVNLSLAVNYALHGERVFGYHLVNLAIHIVAALTLLGIVRRTVQLPVFGGRFERSATRYATVVALLWGLHPLNTEAVTYVIQRTESLFSMFYLLTLYFGIRGSTGGRGWLAAAIAACLLGMGCKEAMATAPLIILLYDRAFVARSWNDVLRRRWAFYLGLASTWGLLALLLMRSSGARGGAAGFGLGMTWWEYARTQCWAVAHYLRLAFWPGGLAMDYGTWTATTFGEIVPSALLAALLIAATAVAWVRWPWAGFLGTWFFVLLAPSSSVVPLVTQTVAEKRMYLPLAGVIALTVFAGAAAGRRWMDCWRLPDLSRRRIGILTGGALACVALALGLLTVRRNRDYRSAFSIWNDTVGKRPENARAYFNRARLYGELGQWDRQMADYGKAIELRPDFVEAYNDRGNLCSLLGDHRQALADFSKAIELRPDLADSYNNRGVTYMDLGAFDRAVEDFTKAIAISPDRAECYSNRANARNALGHYAQVIADCDRAMALMPDLAEPYYHRGKAFGGLGDNDRALADYSRLIELKPDLPEAYDLRGAIYLRMGAYERAVPDFTRAVELRADFASAYANRAMAYCRLKAFEKAWADIRVLQNLGAAIPPQLAQLLIASPPPAP